LCWLYSDISDAAFTINNLGRDAEEAAGKGDIKTLYNLSDHRRTIDRPVRDNTGSLLTKLNS